MTLRERATSGSYTTAIAQCLTSKSGYTHNIIINIITVDHKRGRNYFMT